MSTKKRLTNIDLIEAIAIFFVLLYHTKMYAFDYIQNNSPSVYLANLFFSILSTCVPLFFFANGYLLFNREFNLKKHIYKIIKLIVIVFIWGFVLMPIYMLIAKVPVSWETIYLSVLNADGNWSMHCYWFLGALVCLYIFFPALKALFDTNKKAFVFFTIACSVFTIGFTLVNNIMSIVSAQMHINPPVSLNYTNIIMFNPFRGIYGYSFVYFCVGGLINCFEDKILAISAKKRNIICVIGIVVSCLLLFGFGILKTQADGRWYDSVWYGYDSVFTFCNVIFIYILSLNYKKDYSFIRNISINTLGIYFLHELVFRLTKSVIQSMGIQMNFWLNFVYSFLILCVCLVCCMLLRKIPVVKNLVG